MWKTSSTQIVKHATSTHDWHSRNLTGRTSTAEIKYTYLPSIDSKVVKEDPLEKPGPLLLLLKLLVLLHLLASLVLRLFHRLNDGVDGVDLEPRLDSVSAQACSHNPEVVQG